MLVGRTTEIAVIDRVIGDARLGRSRALVLRGDPGVGKSTLLRHAIAAAEGFRVITAVGSEAERGVPFAGLHALLRSLLGLMDRIPPTQAAALRAALAIEAARPDRLASSAGTLSMLSVAAEERPLLVAIDDGHWLDRASAEAVVFAARRLAGESTAILVTVRANAESPFDAGLERLVIPPLGQDPALELIRSTWGEAVHPAVARRVVTETGGNPLAIIHVTELLTERQRGGLEPLGEHLPVADEIALWVRRRLRTLPAATRQVLLLVAAGLPDEALGPDESMALEVAEDAGLVDLVDGTVRFVHPLFSSATYRLASTAARRRAHRAIADRLTGGSDADRRALHLATAATAPDEAVAASLEVAADRARARGGYAAQAAALARAADLSPRDADRARRSVAAAGAAYWAGDPVLAMSLAERAVALAIDDPSLYAAAVHRLAIIADWHGQWTDRVIASDSLASLADRILALDPIRAVGLLGVILQRHFQALDTRAALELAERRSAMCASLGEERRMRALQDLARAAGLRGDTERCNALCDAVLDASRSSGEIGFATNIAEPLIWLERYPDARDQLEASVEAAGRQGNLVRRAFELTNLALLDTRIGAFARALATAAEAVDLAEASGNDYLVACNLAVLTRLDALRGDAVASQAAADRALAIAARLRDALIRGEVLIAQGLAALADGHAADAIDRLEPVRDLVVINEVGELSVLPGIGDLIEAYIRAGRTEDARVELERFEEQAGRLGRRWAIAAAARCRGLLASGDEFDDPFGRSLDVLTGVGASPFERARTHLCYGERLRRSRRRREAREHLRAAIETFDRSGAVVWADRARAELRATGEHVPTRDPTAPERLTPQELQIARQVVDGRSNREIAETMFLSTKTVEFHLTRAYRKLDVHSRAQLVRVLARDLGDVLDRSPDSGDRN